MDTLSKRKFDYRQCFVDFMAVSISGILTWNLISKDSDFYAHSEVSFTFFLQLFLYVVLVSLLTYAVNQLYSLKGPNTVCTHAAIIFKSNIILLFVLAGTLYLMSGYDVFLFLPRGGIYIFILINTLMLISIRYIVSKIRGTVKHEYGH